MNQGPHFPEQVPLLSPSYRYLYVHMSYEAIPYLVHQGMTIFQPSQTIWGVGDG